MGLIALERRNSSLSSPITTGEKPIAYFEIIAGNELGPERPYAPKRPDAIDAYPPNGRNHDRHHCDVRGGMLARRRTIRCGCAGDA